MPKNGCMVGNMISEGYGFKKYFINLYTYKMLMNLLINAKYLKSPTQKCWFVTPSNYALEFGVVWRVGATPTYSRFKWTFYFAIHVKEKYLI